MRSRSSAVDHEAAVARRLELLSHELAAVREGDGGVDGRGADAWASPRLRPLRAVDADPDGSGQDAPDEHPVDGSLGLDVGRAPGGSPSPSPPIARIPGRHASRRTTRAGAGWGDLVPPALRGRVGLGAGQVVAVALVAVLGLVATCWFLVRGSAHEVGAPIAVQTPVDALVEPAGSGTPTVAGDPSASPTPGASGEEPGAAASQVVVDVAGKVRHPGIAVLHAGDRVVDAIRAAGGARPGVDLRGLNLAQVLTDGEQIVVGGAAPPPATVASGSPGTTALVNLNTADQVALESLPEVGPVTAQAIIAWRTEHGGFSAVSQLLDVDGIGDATLAQITPFVTV